MVQCPTCAALVVESQLDLAAGTGRCDRGHSFDLADAALAPDGAEASSSAVRSAPAARAIGRYTGHVVPRSQAAVMCPSCGSAVGETRIEVESGVAQCPCGHVFALADAAVLAPDAPPAASLGVSTSTTDDGVRMRLAWNRAGAFAPLAVAGMITFSSVLPLSLMASGELQGVGSGMAGVWVVLPVLVGVYLGLAILLNATEIVVEGGAVRVHHGPIPWWPGPIVDASRIRALDLCRTTHRARYGRIYHTYALVAVGDGEQATLLRGHREIARVAGLKEALEHALAEAGHPIPSTTEIRDRSWLALFRG